MRPLQCGVNTMQTGNGRCRGGSAGRIHAAPTHGPNAVAAQNGIIRQTGSRPGSRAPAAMCAPCKDTPRPPYARYAGFSRDAKDTACMNLHFCGILPVCVRLTNPAGVIIIIEISGMNDGVCAAATATVFFIFCLVRVLRTSVRILRRQAGASFPAVSILYFIKKRSGTTPWQSTSSSVC